MKNLLIINGHPNPKSYCRAVCEAYEAGAQSAGHQVQVLHLHELAFDLRFTNGYKKPLVVEPDIAHAQDLIRQADHIVLVHPVWWGSVPALLKGFLDATLLPGFAFQYKKDSPLWDKLLKGKTASIIYTADTPPWIYHWVFGAPSVQMLRKRVLGFCGIKTTEVKALGPLRHSSPEKRLLWLTEVEKLGCKLK